MPSRYPSVNETLSAIRNSMNRGSAMGGQTQAPTNIGAGANMRPQSPARGGATAGLAGNPSRGGDQTFHGMGPSLVPNGMPTQASATHSAKSIVQIPHLVRNGQMEHARGMQLMRQHQAHIDKYSTIKRNAAMKASRPKGAPNFGSLADDADGGPMQNSLLSSGGGSDVPSGSALGTTRLIAQQRTSGGRSAVPNSSSGPGRRGGPGYDW
jgi:hypothetical protein